MPNSITLFIESRSGYYYYYNWTAKKENAIHWCECGRCNYGAGMRREQTPGLNGVWIGPFENLEDANRFVVEELNQPLNHCTCVGN